MRLPPSVMMLSGWNCTPCTLGYFLWRTPITVPSSVHAVTSRSAGIVSRLMTRLWYLAALKGLGGPVGGRGEGGGEGGSTRPASHTELTEDGPEESEGGTAHDLFLHVKICDSSTLDGESCARPCARENESTHLGRPSISPTLV